jgi:broad specificity phosphatase PhoE
VSTTALLIRHGHVTGLADRLIGRDAGAALSSVGQQQAAEAGRHLRDVPAASVYCSPQTRAVQTAQPIAGQLGVEVGIDHAFDEVDYGDWTGVPFEQLPFDARWMRFNEHRVTTRAPGGESLPEVQARAVQGLQTLRQHHHGDTVIVVTHAEVIRAVLLDALGLPLSDWWRLRVDPASVSALRDGQGFWTVIAINVDARDAASLGFSRTSAGRGWRHVARTAGL